MTEQAREIIPPGGYLTPDWYEARRQGVSASEIAAILGLSPWQSAFDLFWEKRTGHGQDANDEMRRGRRVEPLILEDFTEAHPEFHVANVGLMQNLERPWQLATPDGLAFDCCPDTDLIHDPDCAAEPVAVVETKSAANASEWGHEGTDEIPVYYRTQVLWQMDVLGLNVAYVPVWFGFGYKEYEVEYHEADCKLMREAAEAFLADVAADRQPDIDSHKSTRQRLKRLHPELVDESVEIPLHILRQRQAAKRLRDAAQDRMNLAENRVRALLGPAARAVYTDGLGKERTFSHTITDIRERTQTVAAHTRNQINFPRKEIQ